MTKALLAVGAFAAMVVVAVVAIALETAITGDDPRTSDPGDSAAAFILDEGDCFDDGTSWDPDAHVTVISCDDPHDSEIVGVEEFSTFGSYTAEEVAAEAEDECTQGFEDYVAALPADADVVLRLYHPEHGRRPIGNRFGERSWDLACVAWSADGRFGG